MEKDESGASARTRALYELTLLNNKEARFHRLIFSRFVSSS
jgi:hypothetical protein